jgi:hypothetical protein
MRAPLISGDFQARSAIANNQRCVNLYPERNPPDAPYPYTHYVTPGLTQLVAGTGFPSRCVYTASNGQLFEVIGKSVYATSARWVRTLLGTISAGSTPVSMADNGLCALIVDGSANGWVIDLATLHFAPVSGQNGAFYGGTRVDYIDTYFILNRPGTAQWYISLSNCTFANMTGTVTPDTVAAAFDPLAIVSKTGYPDFVQGPIVMHREAWIVGTQTSEVWYDAGNADFPLAELPGVFVEHGAVAPYSLAKQDLSVYWLSMDKQGQAIVMTGNQYVAKRISTHAIEQQIQSYATIDDAVGFTYQQLGHTFYVLAFPTADATWVYDVAEEMWHQRVWIDTDGVEHRHRANNAAAAYGLNVCGDWETGALYAFDLANLTDFGGPIVRRRGFPTIEQGNRRVSYSRLILDMDVGEVAATLLGHEPQISLRFSDDRGKTWGQPLLGGIGATGQFNRSVLFTRLGLGRQRLFEVFWDTPSFTAINGGDVDFEVAET